MEALLKGDTKTLANTTAVQHGMLGKKKMKPQNTKLTVYKMVHTDYYITSKLEKLKTKILFCIFLSILARTFLFKARHE